MLRVEVNTGECPRCKGATKVPNPKPGPYLIDCPDCQGTGRVEVLPSCWPEEIEVEHLRQQRETARKAAGDLNRLLALIAKGLERETSPFHAQLKSYAAEGLASAAALVELLTEGGAR